MADKQRLLPPTLTDGYIHRLEVDLSLDQEADAYDARLEADSCYDRYIGPVVEDVIGRYSRKYQLDIESIEIDLGKISKEDLPKVLRARLEAELERRSALTDKVDVPLPEEVPVSFDFEFTGDNASGLSPFDAVTPFISAASYDAAVHFEAESSGRRRSSFTDIVEATAAITDYLLEEVVPWMVPADGFRPEDIVSDFLAELLGTESFVRALFSGRDAFIRFIDLLDEEAYEYFQSRVKGFVDDGIVDPTALSQSEGAQSPSVEGSWNSAFPGLVPETSSSNGTERETAEGTAGERYLAELIRNAHDSLVAGRLPDGFPYGGGIDGNPAPTGQLGAGKEKLATGTAGLVIFHPFLKGFFHNLGLTDSHNEFVSGQAQIEAVHILHHIAAPESKHHSHELILEKLLCGLPLNAAVPMNWKPDNRTEEEISGLCSAVCSYWKPLKNTSREGLRTSFIARNGLLGEEDGTFVLHVENQALDILMEDLPWEISAILLSWSGDILMVDWQTQ